MKRIKKLSVPGLVLVMLVTLFSSVNVKAEGRNEPRVYQWGPFNCSGMIKTITIPEEDAKRMGISSCELAVFEDYFEMELAYDRMGWRPDEFDWIGQPMEYTDLRFPNPGSNAVYKDDAAIGIYNNRWESFGGGVGYLMPLFENGWYYHQYRGPESFIEYDDYMESDGYCFHPYNVRYNDYTWSGLPMFKSQYDYLISKGFPESSSTPAVPMGESAPDTTPDTPTTPVMTPQEFTEAEPGTIYRLLNPSDGEHLYSTDVNECRTLTAAGWIQETSLGISAPEDGVGVYRLVNTATSEHLFTADKRECKALVKSGAWQYDNGGNPIFYGLKEGGTWVYRLYNSAAGNAVSSHHYSADTNEISVLLDNGWKCDNDGMAVFRL